MNIYECEEFFKQINPGKNVTLELDGNCHRRCEIVFTDGVPNDEHHFEFDRVKVCVEGQDPVYIKILPHRITYTSEAIKQILKEKFNI